MEFQVHLSENWTNHNPQAIPLYLRGQDLIQYSADSKGNIHFLEREMIDTCPPIKCLFFGGHGCNKEHTGSQYVSSVAQ